MSHNIRGFIARADGLRRVAGLLQGSRVVPLSLGFGFLPITAALAGDGELAPFDSLERLTARLGEWAERSSATVPMAYVETDYFGGIGTQAAMAWVGGMVALGPVRTSVGTPLLDGAINRAIRFVGVVRGSTQDEFDAIGLGLHRSNESWMSQADTQ